ncbi:hypothetical protein jhhlp_004968 [Lomentospora prolificans]|uniref:Carrier domain-containing protein n=1 Tax=Lomentospora prolificans TaxID=41688 RepID=A0A2N3N897_9PEZI|nr:hypothetical protein jhhlp_004968 [Lomentospora prolificans]
MQTRTSSTEITKKTFWTQRLQAVENNTLTPMFFDKAIAPPAPGADSIRSGKGDAYGRTAVPVTVNPRDLQVAAVMHHVSPESIVMVAWALLLRSYAGEDGPINFGACLDREQAAWLFTMPVSADEQLLSAMRSAEQEKRLMLDYGLTFRSLGSFVQETGYHDIATAVYIHSGNTISPHMYFPAKATLVVCVAEGALVQVHLDYRRDVISTERAQSLVDNFGHVLATMTKRMQSINRLEVDALLIKDIETVSKNDYRRIVEFSARLPPRLDMCVHEMVFARCMDPKFANRVAVESWDGVLTYSDVAKYAQKLATVIADTAKQYHRQDGEQLFVPFCLAKSKWTPVAILATMAAGGACVPLEPSHPAARKNEIIAQTNAKIVLTNSGLLPEVAGGLAADTPVKQILCVDQEEDSAMPANPATLPAVRPDDLCYIIFTSGSSGTPKGVKWQHAALSTSMSEHGRAFHMGETTRILQFASHVFDVSVAELITPLFHGARVIIPADSDRTDPEKLAAFMQSKQVNCAMFVASYARLLRPEAVPSLKTLILGGESIGQDNLDKWTPVLDRLIIGYGTAETCINCAKNEFSVQTMAKKPWRESLGHAAGGRMLIADRSDIDKLVPIGAIGEIVVEGPILAEGYLNDEAKTARAYVENPAWIRKTHFWPAKPRRRFYRTGDLGFQDMHGGITFVGRADFQVKVRGQRFELGEIRSHIVNALSEAIDVHVDVISVGGDKALAAFLSFGQPSQVTGGSIQVHRPDSTQAEALRRMVDTVRATLPPAAVPTFFIPMATFPYLVSGKVDRRALLGFTAEATPEQLAAYNSGFMAADVDFVAPESDVEEKLATCCKEILKLPSLGMNENFFVSGGDSISAIKVVAAARARGVEISVNDIFNTSSIRELAKLASGCTTTTCIPTPKPFSLLSASQANELLALAHAKCQGGEQVVDIYPCTPLQEALMALSTVRTGAYVAQHVLDLPAYVDLEAFRQAWEVIFRRQDILRSRILTTAHGVVQAVYNCDIEWLGGVNPSAYCKLDKSTPMGFDDKLVRFGLVGRTFIFTIHHSLFDGWSITRLFEDVERCYAGQTLLEMKPYSMFIKFQSGLDFEGPKQFWSSNLGSDSGLASCHFPQNLSSSYTPVPDSSVRTRISTSDYTRSGFTMPTRIRAAWALLMGRYIDCRDVIFGETLSGRTFNLDGVEAVAGPTISTVPIRVTWDEQDSIQTILQNIQKSVVEVTNAGHIGLQTISRLSASAQEACQFQHIIVIQPKRSSFANSSPNDERISAVRRIGLENASLDLRSFHSYALNMDFTLDDEGVTVTTTFDSSVFGERDIEYMQAQFSNVLDQICRAGGSSQAKVADINYACAMDLELQAEINAVQNTNYEQTTLVNILEKRASKHPNSTAIHSWDGQMTYHELNFTSTVLANYLSSRGLRKGDFVPYCFYKSMWTTVAIMATLKLGGVSVALEPSHPDSSVAKVFAQVSPKLVLCSSSSYAARLQRLGQEPFIVSDESVQRLIRSNVGAVERRYTVRPDDDAFVVFTSGSTGEPKGIPLQHGSVCIMAKQHGEAMNIDKSSRILQFAAHVFDVSIGDLAISIYHGACLCVPSDDDRMNNLARAINGLEANRAWLTPTVATLISPAECPSLTWLSVGGEQLSQVCKDIWAGVPLVNVYGPAEVTNLGTAVTVSAGLPITNLGRGNGARIWICEPNNPQQLAPTGCIGEIVFEGPNVTRGYLNNAELTNRSFPEIVPWIASGDRHQQPVRMYRTGDLARLNVDGSLDFKGRRDTQIKLRGQRIEVTAIESALQAAIQETVDLAVDIIPASSTNRDATLAAFLYLPERLTQTTSIDDSGIFSTLDLVSFCANLRSQVANTLPPHMIPALFIPLQRVPKLVSGKIDRKTLRLAAAGLTNEQIGRFKLDQATQKRAPTNPTEATMLGIWASVLGVQNSDIGIDDHFVSLGGDSISAIKLVANARSKGMEMRVANIFENPTIARLCAACFKPAEDEPIEAALPISVSASVASMSSAELSDIATQCGISVEQIEDIYPCTALQEGMLMLTEKNPTAYIAHHVMGLPSWVDITIFRKAWEIVVTENTILRTRIVPSGQQIVLRPSTLSWIEPATNDLQVYVKETQQQPMGFGAALSRQAILHNPTRFVFTAHHSIYDGWSMELLSEAINKAYSAVREGGKPQQTSQRINFRDFVDYVSGVDKSHAQNFWREQLDGVDPAQFPPRQPTSYEALADSMVEKKISLLRNARSTATTSTLIRAAWALLISAYTGSHADVVFGSAGTGRSVPVDGVLGLIGPTLATVPFRVVLDGEQKIEELLSKIQLQSMSMLEFEHYGLQNIRKAGPSAPAACNFQSLLVVHAEAGSTGGNTSPGLSWANERFDSDFLTTAITLECQPMGTEMQLTASYDSSLMDGTQVNRILSTFEHILTQLCISRQGTRVSDIDTMSPDDRAELAKITRDLPTKVNDLVHEMFMRQARATPHATAVSAWDGDLTYQQLDQLSTKLSHHLRSLGLRPDMFVPFCFEKSKWVPVSLLGILKAGGACVPLDPSQPLERLQSIIGTLEAKIILTSSTHSQLLKSIPGSIDFVEVSESSMARFSETLRFSLGSQPTPSSACYAIFTSGSTGTPKGVVWEHSALCSSMMEHGVAFNYATTTRVLQFSSHTFDVSVSELLTTLMYGGCICIPDDFTRLNGITDFINDKKVNWAFFAPSFARLLDPSTIPGLRTIVLGGEAPGKDNIERWSGRPGLELIVTYGPAESCIYCAKNSVQGPQIDGSIGHSIGGMMWVADLGQPDHLAPIGAVGEIVVEGSILARGYLKDPEKTKSSFRPMPANWANGRSQRVYYTGDLGCVNTDGTISCLGRRDDQVKIRGQRVELPDIEYNLRKDEAVRQALVLYPRTGPCADHLVGILAMKDGSEQTGSKPSSSTDISLAPRESWSSTADVQDRLADKVPTYMVPSLWIVLESIPLMPASQKVNRKQVSEWVKQLDSTTYERIASMSTGQVTEATQTVNNAMEAKVRNLWSTVLNVSAEIIGPSTSFLRLGGDSISAMQIVSRCRDHGIHVTVQDLLKSRTLADFCERASAASPQSTVGPALDDAETEEPFDLSPIQNWFMALSPEGENHFNQSHLLRLTQSVKFEDLEAALLQIIERHPMLRARFQETDGKWKQFCSNDARGSLQCRQFPSVTMKKAASYGLNAQASLDIVSGPLVAADLYEMVDGTSALFITCHHLVVDLVSWRIILQELEEILQKGHLVSQRKPVSFRAWSRLLQEYAESQTQEVTCKSNLDFWGITTEENIAVNITERSFTIDPTTTQLLLNQCNDAFNTEPLDILLTAVAQSLNTVFSEARGPIPVFNEGHGREPWRSDIDLSSTVGWFTSMFPVQLENQNSDTLQCLVRVKDSRRQIPGKGLPFFSSFAKSAYSPVEVTFNYFGLYQQLERKGALFNWMSWSPASQPPDASPDVPRFSVFDVSAGIENGTMTVNFAYCNKVRHQGLVNQWIDTCQQLLNALIRATAEKKESSLTLSDLPHLSLTYEELDALLNSALPEAGIAVNNVQSIRPCSPMQTALLVSQAVDSSLYAVRYVWEVLSKTSTQRPSIERVEQAWKQVVQQHPMLRTSFIQGPRSNGSQQTIFNQVILKEFDPPISVCSDTTAFPVGRPADHLKNGPPHHITLHQDNSGKVLVQLDISHTLIDGTSVNLLLDSLIKAYDNGEQVSPKEDCYADYVSYLQTQDIGEARSFWKAYLGETEPCIFPTINHARNPSKSASEKLAYLDFKYPSPDRLHSACTESETTAASVFKLAWALLLQAYTGNSSPSFGYLASGRDLPIQGIESSIGPYINMLVCKVPLEKRDDNVASILKAANLDYANCLSHQICSLSEMLRGLQLSNGRLFNTVMSVQRLLPPGSGSSTVNFEPVHVEDPSEFDIVLNIGDASAFVDVSLTYNTEVLSAEQANRLAATFNHAIDSIIDSLSDKLGFIQLMTPEDYQQVTNWNMASNAEAVAGLCDDLVDLNVRTKATDLAVSGWDLSLTYAELKDLSDALAEHLIARYSLTRNTLVPFCFEKSAWTIVVMLAIMKAGAAFVPLDPKHPTERQAHIAKKVRAPLIVSSVKNEAASARLSASLNIQHLVVGPDTIKGMRKAFSTGLSRRRSSRNTGDLAYCLFTSGSTGEPKGVLIHHEALCTSTTHHGRAFGYTECRSLQFASYAFDACIAEIFTTLVLGGCVCVPFDAQKMDPEQLMHFIETERVNLAFLTPSFLTLLDPIKVPSISRLLLGGEVVPQKLVEAWQSSQRQVYVVYGPTECCVYCTGIDARQLVPEKSLIGNSVGSIAWITDAADYNKLVPIGAIGELLIEGPIVSQGYLDDEAKTSTSFVKPTWLNGYRTVYRTGDLVRYHSDGSIEYIGRRDNQVKLRGQRLELGDIEQQVIKGADVKQCVAFLPKQGLCSQKIVAVLTFKALNVSGTRLAGSLAPAGVSNKSLRVLTGGDIPAKLISICQAAADNLPPYMVPSAWLVTDELPLMPSGKADRRFIASCIAEMGDEVYQLSTDLATPSNNQEVAVDLTPAATTLRTIWSSVLNVPESRINPASGSFIRLGGDSISAMEVVAQSRGKGIPLAIENLLKATSIISLAASFDQASIVTSGPSNRADDDDDASEENIVLFSLAPIQRMFAKLAPGENHFNQSFLLKVSTNKKRVTTSEICKALDAIVRRHAMLRARFQKLGKTYKQWIEPEVTGSYVFRSHCTQSLEAAAPHIEETQTSLDLVDGPVFAGDLFEVGQEQYIFLTAHHMVIDLVSWRIVLKDLEDYLILGALSSYRSLSFQKWCNALNSHRKSLADSGEELLPFKPPKADFDFWGMSGKPNYASDFRHHQFTLSKSTSQSLLSACNVAFGTEPIDLFISAIMHSFIKAFPGREIPAIYNEGHGREPWNDQIDLSRTVGWFTTISPVWVSQQECGNDIVDIVKRVKDVRRKITQKGFPYFTSLDFERQPFEVDVSFNYFGSFQQLERSDALLNQVQWRNIGIDPCEISQQQKKFSLIDIAAESENDQLIFTFSFNTKMQKSAQLEQWIDNCQASLEQIARSLSSRDVEHTVGDFEHLPETYDLEALRNTTFKELDISDANISDIYPCSPSQQGMLLSQTKDAEMYWFRSIYEVRSNIRQPISARRLVDAWSAVVNRHPALRTIFIEQNSTDGLYDQLVLRDFVPEVPELAITKTCSEDALLKELKIYSVPQELQSFKKPQHLLRIVQEAQTGRMFCSFLLSHAIVDGSSMGIILRDFALACESTLADAEEPRYGDYITYLKSRGGRDSDIDYWKKSLEGIDSCFLPSDDCSTAPKALLKADVPLEFGIHARIMAVARDLGVSAFTLLQVTWALTLREYINPDRDDCCFGVVTSGRDLPVNRIQDIVGPFVNILTSKVDLPHDKTIADIASTVHNRFIDNIAHQTSSLAEVMHELGTGSLFNTGMTMQRIVAGPQQQSTEVSFHPLGGEDPTEFDIVVHAIDDGQAMHIHMNYWGNKVSESRADEIATTFSSILSQILDKPDMLPVELNMISEKDLNTLWSWNAHLPPALETRIEDMISNQVARNPNREALWSTEETLTFQDLDVLSTKLATTYLMDVQREEIVPLCFEKSIWVAVAMVAVLKSGGTLVLIDPSHPVERLRQIVGMVKAKLILASPTQADMCTTALGIKTVSVSKDLFERQFTAPITPKVAMMRPKVRSPCDAAYIVFTSGSTGTPKGSVTEHRSFSTATQGYHKEIGQLPGVRVLQFASYSFDASILEILGSLMVGATVCVPSDRERSNQLVSFINKAKVSFAVITPTVASLMNPEDIPTLSTLALCGEPMTSSHIKKWAEKVRLVNAFGPSECCVGSAANPRLSLNSSPKCIGHAVSCCYWVVHPRNHHRLSRVGAVGELLIEGHILARHYLNEEAKTREAFITNPEWARPGRGRRLYKTGDLVYQNPDGTFQYVGRKDTQAKIRGQRLELGDIEQAFKDVIPWSQSVVAEIIQPTGLGPRVAVFFSGQDPARAKLDVSETQKMMGQKIPAYMVPTSIIYLEEMPLMPSGKVDRKKIKSIGASLQMRREKRAGRVPETEMERTLASLWKGVLKSDLDQILADDSFFNIGGDSYTAMKLVTEARAAGIVLNVATVMKSPKLSDMAIKATANVSNTKTSLKMQSTAPFSMIEWTPAVQADASRQCIVPSHKIEDLYPCTPLQEGLFVLSMKQPGSYMARHCYRLSPELNLAMYQKAWESVYESSAILRTHIVQLSFGSQSQGKRSGLYQAVINQPLCWIQRNSLDNYLAAHPVPSLGGPLAQFALIEECDTSRYLVLTMHHAAYDAVSLSMLLDRVEAVYTGGTLHSGTPFREFIKYLEDNKGEASRQFWTRYLSGAQDLASFVSIPTGYVPSADSTFECEMALPVVKSNGHTLSTIIRASWAIVMARQASSHGSVFGETLSGRSDSQDGISDVDGPLITTVPVHCHLDDNDNINDVLSMMQEAMVNMIPYQQEGLQNIRRMSADANAACDFTCLVTMSRESEAQKKPSIGITPIEGPSSPAIDYPLSVQFIVGEKELKLSVCHDDRLIGRGQMNMILDHFALVLEQVCSGKATLVGDIGMNAGGEFGVMNNEELKASMMGMLGQQLADTPVEMSPQEQSKVDSDDVPLPPANLEREIRALWGEILDLSPDDLQPEDSFFQLGGDSIGAMRMVTAADQRQIKITVADIFHHPTLEAFCDFASRTNAIVSEPALTDVAPIDYEPFAVLDHLSLDREDVVDAVCRQLSVFPGDVEDVYPATDYQAWAVSHGLMRSRGNTNYFLFRLHGNLDTFRLEQACRKMVAANPILRTLFTTIGSQVMQVVLRSYQIEFQRYGREHRADDAFIRWLVEQDTHRTTYLSQSIVRFKLLLHTEGHYVLVMRASHAQYDGMSLPLLYQDLEKCFTGQEPLERPEFGKFIMAATQREDDATTFWGNLLEGSSMTEIVQHPGPAYKHNVDTIRTRTIPPIPANVAGMSQATLVKAAWALVLAKMSGQRDVVFGNLIFGRNIPVQGIQDVAGPCINMIPVRVKLNEMDSVLDLLALVQEQQLAAMPHESLGFRRLIKNCTDWPDWTRFSSVVQHQNLGRNGAQEFQLGSDLKCEMGVLGPAYDSSDLWVQTTPLEDCFKVEIGSCSSVVSPDIAETLLDRLCAILNVFGQTDSTNNRHLWELLARDHEPLIPIKSSIVDQVWSDVLPHVEEAVPWDVPYFELWGDEIAPVRFLQEYAYHGIILDMEDILENPTKQAQMLLTARVLADRKAASRESAGPSRSASFWALDSNATPSSSAGTSRRGSAINSPRVSSPGTGPLKRHKPFNPPNRAATAHFASSGSRPQREWDLPSPLLSEHKASTASLSTSSRSSSGKRNTVSMAEYGMVGSTPKLGRKWTSRDW